MKSNWVNIFLILAAGNVSLNIFSVNIPAVLGWFCAILWAGGFKKLLEDLE